jgi:hypothetical protein
MKDLGGSSISPALASVLEHLARMSSLDIREAFDAEEPADHTLRVTT